MIIENKNFLRQRFPHILNNLIEYQKGEDISSFQITETKSGDKTIEVFRNGRSYFLHSKYSPQKEAEKFINQFEDEIDNYDHVLFYGIGFGYHVKEFLRRFPNYTFSIYEPSLELFNILIKEYSLTRLPLRQLKNIFVEFSTEEGKKFLENLTLNIQERILLVVLPSYQQVFKDKFQHFAKYFKEMVEAKRQNFYVDYKFSFRWTLNSLINFPKTIKTPNILDEEFKIRFKNKPVIIVSAGPSLEEDYENLRYIKKHKLAYIFAVGSANRALVAQNILPDAVCTYDPQGHNYQVFASIIDQGITTIPMIYGTSVGYETLDRYPGTKLHMITSQDTVAPLYLRNVDGSNLEGVFDSPTIAAVTFQLVANLGCNPIIFAGQNLAYLNNLFYAKDVEYKQKNRSVQISEKEKQNVLFVDDVNGNRVETNSLFIHMRENIELKIKQFPNIEVINTTKGGAAIKGTVYKPLEELIEQRLTEKVVDENWYLGIENKYDTEFILQQINIIERAIEEFRKIYWQIEKILQNMKKSVEEKKEKKLEKLVVKFDKLMKKLVANECFMTYIKPINRNYFQALSIQAANIRKQSNEIDRTRLIINSFGPFLESCKQIFEKLIGSIYKIHWTIINEIEGDSHQFYSCDCGLFQYIGEWEKIDYSVSDTFNNLVKQMVAKGISILKFKFNGTFIRILGSKIRNGSNQIQITIDGDVEMFSAKNIFIKPNETPKINEVLFEKYNLENKEHTVEIKLLDNDYFLFTGVEMEKAINSCK